MADGTISKIQLPDNTIYDVVDNTSGYMTGMTILSYGSSTWQNFIDAYSSNKVVYCRASSNSNPASGSQTRLAFMAYVNNATTPTEVEFQYYRSVSSHTASQQGDQVYVYKLNKTNGWSVTVREASVKVVAGTGLGGTYKNGTMTLTGPTKVSDLTNDSGFITSAGTGLSKSGTTLNHSNSITAQTTQAVYPIKIDAQGHISDYGTAIDLEEMKLFLVTLTAVAGSSGTYESDKTAKQIYDAFNAGRVVLLYAEGSYILLSYIYGEGNYYQADFYKSEASTGSFHEHQYIIVTDNGVTSVDYTDYETPVNNATLTIQKNGTTVNSFTANASSNVTANITVPTKVSDLTNDSGFISDSAYMHTDNNYTTIEKNKLNGIAEGAEVNVNANWNENNSTSASYIQNRPFYLEENAEVVIFEEDIDFSNNYNGVLWNNFSYTFTDAIAVGTSVSLTVDDITLNAAVETEGTNLFIGIRDPADSTRAATNHIGLGLGGGNGYAYQTTYVLALASMFSTGTHHVKLATIADVYHKIDNNFIDLDMENGSGLISVQQKQANASGDYSSAFGAGTAIGGYAHAEGNGTSASGACAHAEGAFTKTSAQTAHAEGAYTTASGESAHAEGSHTTASAQTAHAEGSFATASGIYSHAEGASTTASGWSSHAEGNSTIANHNAQHVFGEYNIADDSAATTSNRGNYVEIVGNGSKSTRSNARTLDWSGNEVLAGKLTIGAVGTDSMDVATIGQLPTVPANIVNTITTTAGTHTAISSKTGAVSFNVPTKTSHLTNDSGFINSIKTINNQSLIGSGDITVSTTAAQIIRWTESA